MKKSLVTEEMEVQKLHDQVRDLESQLAKARSALDALDHSGIPAQDRIRTDGPISRVLFGAPYPVMIRRSDGKIVMINAVWTEITGYALEDIPTVDAWARLAYGEQASERKFLILQEGFTQTGIKKWGEFEVHTRSGNKRIWDFSTAPLGYDENGRELVMVMTVDVTEHRQAAQALSESEERFSKAFRKAPFTMNITRWHDGAILDMNDAWLDLLGWKREEVLGKTTAEFPFYVRPRNREVVRQRIMNDETMGGMELQLVRKDGTQITVTVATTIIEVQGERCILGVLNDITEQKKAAEALRESEHRYRELFETMQEGLIAAEVITDENFKPIDYRYLDVNPATERQFGIPREQFIGRTYTEVLPEEDPEWIEILGRVALTGQPAHVERFGRVNKRWFEAHAYSPRAGEVVAVLTDITERKEAEQALRESEQKFSLMFDKAPFAAALFQPPAGVIINVNEEFERVFGYSRKEAIGKTSVELGVNADEKGWERTVAELQAKGTARNIETLLKTKSGEPHCFLLNIDVVSIGEEKYILQTAGDITERKQAERALRQSEQLFHSLADSMPQLVWTALPDGTVDYYNKRHLEYHEIKQVETLAWEWAPVLHPEDVQSTVDAWQRSVATGEVYQMEHRVRMANGSYRWHLSRGIPTLDETGHVTRWFGTATDIHEQKLAQEKLKTYAERLERSNRELEQFAFMASHDLQEPLRKIQVFADLLAERAQTLEDHELEYIQRMRNAAGRMREMVSGLLQLSRVNTRSNPFSEVDLSQVTTEALSDLAEQIRRSGGNVEVAALPKVTGDALQIRQLMQNLIGNALKYHKPQTTPNVRVYARELKEAVQIVVEDEGIGFEQEYAERIFQPFQRLVGRSEFEGSGMGLAICRKIAERHGGNITVQSKPGEGTTFTVTLPVPSPHHAEREHDEYKAADPDC